MIAAAEFKHLVAPGCRARNAQRCHHSFGARVDEAHLVDPADLRLEQFDKFQ